MALPPQQFCVRWNSYHTNLQAVFPRLLLTEQFADVTLACESRQLRCHKLVLSACSGYLERLLLQNPCKHPIVLMRDMRFSEMQALVDFMYKGEVNVTQEELPSLLKSAEALQIRGLCSGDNSGVPAGLPARSDYAGASDALVATANRDANTNGSTSTPPPPPKQTNGRKLKSESPPSPSPSCQSERPEVKEETVEEDGLYYGELDNDQMEFNEDDEPGKPGSSLGQPSDRDFAIANVQCQYEDTDSSDNDRLRSTEQLSQQTRTTQGIPEDHNYNSREPPAFVIQNASPSKIMLPDGVNLIRVDDSHMPQSQQPPQEYMFSKRVRRSETVLRAAADCVSRGWTFQNASEQFNIPISTIRFFMARKGILPRRRRGRAIQIDRGNEQVGMGMGRYCTSPEPPSPSPSPYHMRNYKLPNMMALNDDDPS